VVPTARSVDLWRFGSVFIVDHKQIREKVDDSHGFTGLFLFFVFEILNCRVRNYTFQILPRCPSILLKRFLDAP